MLQLSLKSDRLSEQQLYDYGPYNLRQQLAPVPGVTFPAPDGGKYRQIMVDIDPLKLQARGLTPSDVVNAVNAQNLTLPSGLAKIGDTQYTVRTNAMPREHRRSQRHSDQIHQRADGVPEGCRPSARRLGSAAERRPQRRPALRVAERSQERQRLDALRSSMESERSLRSPARRHRLASASTSCSTNRNSSPHRSPACSREGAIAAGLTGLMILLFLGSWRSTLIVLISIPLSILTSIVILYFMGHTLNTMTLGGMALAVGILVDNSTVTIENTHRLRSEGMNLAAATLHGSAGIAVPTMVSTLAISCVFTSVVFLEGPAKFLFTPLGLAVVFAMLASYALSRTLTPVMIGLLLKGEHHGGTDGAGNWFARFARALRAWLRAVSPRLSARPDDVAQAAPYHSGCRRADAHAGRRHGDRWLAATSSPTSMADRSSSISAHRRQPASKRPSASSRRSKTKSAR